MRSRPKIGLISVGFFLFLLNAGLISIVNIEVNTQLFRRKLIQELILTNFSEFEHPVRQAERERRRRDLQEQSEDHKATVDTIRTDYAVLVDKIKELKGMELEASIEARDSSK